MASVAFIGLGRMGLGMAGRLLVANHEVRVFNRTTTRADALVPRGARKCVTAREACIGADAVVSMVADDPASRAIWLGSDGVLAANVAPGAFAIECSTLSYNWVMDLSAAATAQGLRYVDAPVTGLPDTAAAGELTLLVGANPEHLAAARALLGAFSQRLIHFGPVGTGTAYKLLVNMLGAVQIASAAETMAIAERIGLDLGMVAEALSTGQAASPQVIRNTRRIAEGEHDRDIAFTPQLRLKDVEYALELGRQFGIGSPFGTLAGRVFRELCDLGYAQANESKVVEVAKRQPVEQVSENPVKRR